MRIGIDVDGVIMNSENEIRVQAELDDIVLFEGKGPQHPEKFLEIERYDWNKQQIEEFRKHMEEILLRAPLMPGVKQVINLLKQEGDELIVISARGIIGLSGEDTKKQLEKQGLIFDNYYWEVENKLEICQKEQIDLMIDDRASHIEKIANAHINTIYFRDINRKKIEENHYIKEANHWGEVYRQIKKLKEERKEKI